MVIELPVWQFWSKIILVISQSNSRILWMLEFQSHTSVRSDRGSGPPGRTLPLDPPRYSWSDLNEAFSISIFHSYFAGLWGANDCFCHRRPVISCNISCTWEVSRTCDHTIYGTGGCLPCRGRHLSFDSARKYGRKQLSKSEEITSCRIYGILFV